jgi:hypothetical protein
MVWLRLYHGAAAPGLTCEVHNTDAEGRFVVGDGCSYLARELGVKTLIDSATLTGHSSFTGANHCAMMTNDEDMEVTGLASGLQSGETGTFSHIACVASAGSMRCICWEHALHLLGAQRRHRNRPCDNSSDNGGTKQLSSHTCMHACVTMPRLPNDLFAGSTEVNSVVADRGSDQLRLWQR